MTFVPTKRLQVARLFLGDKIKQAKEKGPPSENDPSWIDKSKIQSHDCELCWIKSSSGVKLAFYFSKFPHWYEIDEPVLIEDFEHFSKVS